MLGIATRTEPRCAVVGTVNYRTFEFYVLVIGAEMLTIRGKGDLAVMNLTTPVPDCIPIAVSRLNFH